MTIDEFMERLEQTPRQWEIGVRGSCHTIRLNGLCPITAVEGSGKSAVNYLSAARALGLSTTAIYQITEASDYGAEGLKENLRPLRRRLLKACGLPPEDDNDTNNKKWWKKPSTETLPHEKAS